MAYSGTFTITRGSVGYLMTYAAMSLRSDQNPLYTANDYTFNFVFVNSNGTAVDLTGATLVFIAKYSVEDTDGEAIFNKSLTINTPATAGTAYCVFIPTTVPGPQAVLGYFAVQKTVVSVVETLVQGNIEFLPHI